MSISLAQRLLEAQIATGDPLDVRHFRVSEKMSSLFEISLRVLSPNPDIALDAAVGFPATFTLRGPGDVAPTRTWTGLCVRLQQVQAEESGASTYEIQIAPVLWLATQRRNYRIFQQLSELEIVKKLLGEWGITPVERLSSEYKKRKYRVQYGESDYAFLSRMLEDAGISFHFEAQDGETQLVLSDSPQSAAARAPLAFRAEPTDGDVEHVTGVRVERRMRPGKYTMRDQDYRKPPSYKLMSTAVEPGGPEEQLERYHYTPGGFLFQSDKGDSTPVADDKGKYRADEGEGARIVERRLLAKRATTKVVSFETNAHDLAPGIVLSVLDHPKSELLPGQKQLVIAAMLEGANDGAWSHFASAVSADQPYHPAIVTPKPKVTGVETATVVGPPGETIHTDEFGRVRVQFHWDLQGKMDDASSCWIPVSHGWAGGGFGMVNLPRVGHEVIVDFMGGDPDRPIVVGRVYTKVSPVPYPLPGQKTKSGWKSQTVGGVGYNEIMFEDAPGSELVNMQAEKDLNKLVKNNETVTIGNDRTKQVGNNDTLSVGNDRSHTIGNDETINVGNNQSITIGVNQTITVCADQTITLPSGNQTESITGNRTFTLTGDLTETITGNSTLTQVGNQTTTLTGNSTITQTGSKTETQIGSETQMQVGDHTELQLGSRTDLQLGDRTDLQLGGRKDFQIGSRLDVQLGGTSRLQIGSLVETVIGPATLTTTAAHTQNVGGAMTLNAGTITVNSGEATVNSDPITVNGNTITVNGATITVNGGGVTTIKGSIVKLNC